MSDAAGTAEREARPGTGRPGDVVIREAAPGDLDAITEVVTAAFADDAMMRLMVGNDERAAERLRDMKSVFRHQWRQWHALVAERDGRIVGALSYADSPACQAIGLRDAVAVVRVLGRRLLSRDVLRGMRLMMRVQRAHLKRTHRHLPVIAIDPACQRQGIGGRLLREYERRCDEAGMEGYLETHLFRDPARPSHRKLYERHGFHLDHQIPVSEDWSMITMVRPAATSGTLRAEQMAPPQGW